VVGVGALEWAIGAKLDFVKLQKDTGIPAWFAAAQMVHEAFNGDGTMSGLAAKSNNFAGLKAASWQAQFGCGTVDLPTWEVVNGKDVQVTAAFCTCADYRCG
jgi:flagellum-specific peptidoglycan hydrolase FlgJ